MPLRPFAEIAPSPLPTTRRLHGNGRITHRLSNGSYSYRQFGREPKDRDTPSTTVAPHVVTHEISGAHTDEAGLSQISGSNTSK